MDELTPAQIDTLKKIEAEMKASGDWIVVDSDEWPDEANKALRSLCRQVERLLAALKPFAEADWYSVAQGSNKFQGIVTGAALDEAKRLALTSANHDPV